MSNGVKIGQQHFVSKYGLFGFCATTASQDFLRLLPCVLHFAHHGVSAKAFSSVSAAELLLFIHLLQSVCGCYASSGTALVKHRRGLSVVLCFCLHGLFAFAPATVLFGVEVLRS